MNVNTLKLHDLGQRLWLDNITRDLLDSGTLASYSRASTTWQRPSPICAASNAAGQ